MAEPNTLYLIDGSAYIYRAYHAIRSLTNSKGLPTNASLGFTKMVMKLMEDRQPQHIAMVFDAKGPTFRHDMFPEYKANRPPMPEDLVVQLPYIKEITRGFNLPLIEKSGFEADDLIGTLARQAEEAGFQVVMVTGDKDFVQLVTENAVIWDPMKEKTIDLAAVRENFGVTPRQVIDIMGLSGDASDNVPGVPGIGPKTANALIQEFGSMEDLYLAVDTITRKKLRENLIAFKEQAFLSRRLVTIDRAVPCDFDLGGLQAKTVNEDSLADLFKELEFRQLQQTVSKHRDLTKKDYRMVLDLAGVAQVVEALKAVNLFAIDTETTSVDPLKASLVGISIAYQPDSAVYIPVGHTGEDLPAQPKLEDVIDCLQPVLADPQVLKVGQNIKYDWIVLSRHGFQLAGVVGDTMVASYLINPSKRAHNLDQIALDFLGHKTISYEEVAGKGKQAITFDQVPLDKATPYACEDADITFKAWQVLAPMMESAGIRNLYDTIELPLVSVLMKMEKAGIRVDREKLVDLSVSFAARLDTMEADIYTIAGEQFNIKSSQQLGHILFEKLGLPVQKKTKKKTGYSTDAEVLTQLSGHHELPALILRYRTLAKLKSTYTDALLELIHPDTGRIHTSFNQTITATGRLSSSNPNLQNIPIRDEEGREIRRAFVPRDGWQFLAADYSQIELRILAHVSEDPILIDAFLNDEDIHTRTASEVFQMLPGLITSGIRRQAKAINFGIIYGMSPYGLSKTLRVSQKMAKTYIEHYFARYKGVKTFIDSTIARTRETQQTSTLFGRIRHLPDIASSNHVQRQFAERISINTPIQGTAADLIKMAMIEMDAALEEQGLQTAMLLSVHDELVFEVPPDEKETVSALVKGVMEGIFPMRVPLKINMAFGDNWSDAH
jgi:DNA polymerase-1